MKSMKISIVMLFVIICVPLFSYTQEAGVGQWDRIATLVRDYNNSKIADSEFYKTVEKEKAGISANSKSDKVLSSYLYWLTDNLTEAEVQINLSNDKDNVNKELIFTLIKLEQYINYVGFNLQTLPAQTRVDMEETIIELIEEVTGKLEDKQDKINIFDAKKYSAVLSIFEDYSDDPDELCENLEDYFKETKFGYALYIAAFYKYVELQLPDEALDLLNQAIDADQATSKYYYLAGVIQLSEMENDQAISMLTNCINKNRGYGLAYMARGYAYELNYEEEKALSDYNAAIKFMPKNPEPYFNRASMYYAMQNWDKAIKDWRKVIKLNSNYASAYVGIGAVEKIKGNFDNAIENFTKAIQLNPNLVDAYYNRGSLYYQMQKWEKSLSDLQKVIELNPDEIGMVQPVINQLKLKLNKQ